MRRKLLITLCLLLVFAQACAAHQRQQRCQELLVRIQAAIRAESTNTNESGPHTESSTVIHVPALKARLGMEVMLSQYEEKRGGKKWCRIDFWRKGNHIAAWEPGCSKYEWQNGDLVLFFSLDEGAPYIEIYEDGEVCFRLMG